MGLLYRLSDFLRFILYRLIRYRVPVIRTNLQNAFPTKSKAEIERIEKAFYKHLCDLIVESIKFFTIKKEPALRMMVVKNEEILHELYNEGRDVIIVGGHYANWELYALNAPFHSRHTFYALYTPLSNEWFNNKMKQTRGAFGLQMQSTKMIKHFFDNDSEAPRAHIFGADQSPSNPKKAYWMTFLNQETGVQFGTEKIATEHNMAVVYGQLDKFGRGKFGISYRLICKEAAHTAYGEITEKHARWLEQHINAKPQYWLWSHKRWKHKRPESIPMH
jgi:KDO2-lipid IV(A) lauroyltransferase